MIPPDRRGDSSIRILVQATSRLPFIAGLLNEPAFAETGLHPQLCKHMIAVDHAKGEHVVRRSRNSLTSDDKADRFFIIISGQVAVYRIRDEDDLGIDNEFYKIAIDIIKKNNLDRFLLESGYIAKEVILKFLDDDTKKKFESADHIKASKLRLKSRNWVQTGLFSSIHNEEFGSP